MRFSIIVPVYNVEDYLEDCVQSILQQTYRDFELILVDDGSPDGCPQICDEMAKKDSRIIVIHKSNGGVSDARNAGMQKVSGEYLMFMDSDDKFSYDEVLMDINEEIKNNPDSDILLTKTWGYESNKNYEGYILLKDLLKNGLKGKMFSVTVWDKVYKMSFINTNRFKFIKGYVHEDLLWTVTTISQSSKCTVMNKGFYYKNINYNSITRNVSETSVFNRALSKLNIAKAAIDYFENSAFDNMLKKLVYEFFLGTYVGGLCEGTKIKNDELIIRFRDEIKRTSDVIKKGLKISNLKYRLFGMIYYIVGYRALKSYMFINKLINTDRY